MLSQATGPAREPLLPVLLSKPDSSSVWRRSAVGTEPGPTSPNSQKLYKNP